MPTKKVKATKSAPKKTKKPVADKKDVKFIVLYNVKRAVRPVKNRVSGLMSRRPHRSFRMTKRRDYKRTFVMPGYWSFSNYVRVVLWNNWKLFGALVLVYIAVSILISGLGAQEAYSNLSQTLKSTSGDLFKGNFGGVSQAGLLLLTTVTTGLSPNVTQAQSVLAGIAFFFAWLATIWLLRNTLAGHGPKLRDGLYNSGSPVLATIIVGFIMVLQLLPGAIAIIIYSAAQVSGLLESGFSAVMVWAGVITLALLSLYWITSSFIALVIVTLPGMYPMQAIRAAGDLVVGRRLRVLYRLAWLLFTVVLTWVIIAIPIILFDDWVKGLVKSISWLPLVPIVIVTMGALTLVYVTSYIYLLYRRLVDDDSAPA
jgi:hypothetical protein